MMQNSGPTGSSARALSHGRSCSQPHSSIPTSRRRPPFAASDEDRSAPVVEVVLGERERFLDAQPGAPKDDDHRSHAPAVTVTGGVTHNAHDLVNRRRVGWVPHAFVARRAAGVITGQTRRRATLTRGIQQDGHVTSSDRTADVGAALHGGRRPGYRLRCQISRLATPHPVPETAGDRPEQASDAETRRRSLHARKEERAPVREMTAAPPDLHAAGADPSTGASIGRLARGGGRARARRAPEIRSASSPDRRGVVLRNPA